MITSHLMCVIKQLFYDKNVLREKTITEKNLGLENMLHNKTMPL